MQDRTNQMKEPHVLIVGAGPVGLAHAWAIKKLNQNVRVTVLEKYEEYQRKHTLAMQYQQLEKLIKAVGAEQDPKLCVLLAQLKQNENIRTSELQEKFTELAKENKVEIITEEVKEATFKQQLFGRGFSPDLIIGADGTHSIVSRLLFPKDNQVKHEFDYVLQLRFEVQGDYQVNIKEKIAFYQAMAMRGILATEYVGRYQSDKNQTPVTMQMMISKEAFDQLKFAVTSKTPVRPYSDKNNKAVQEKSVQNENKEDDRSIKLEEKDGSSCLLQARADEELISDFSWDDLPEDVRKFLDSYLVKKIQDCNENNIDRHSIRVSVNEAPATHAKQVFCEVKEQDDIPAFLGGDAALGLSYFKGLNAGIESTAMWMTLLGPVIRGGLSDQRAIVDALNQYQEWFLREFAPKKIKEVASYSTYRIRFGEKVMQALRVIKIGSMQRYDNEYHHLTKAYFDLLAKHVVNVERKKQKWKPYPHRSHGLIHLWQWDYVPITHTLKKMWKLWADYFKPYKYGGQWIEDAKQPGAGLSNIFLGLTKILFSFDKRIIDGLFTVTRGVIELGTFPLALTLKPFTRKLITLIRGQKKIEQNAGANKLVKEGQRQLNLLEDPSTQYSTQLIYNALAVCDDLHRKFDKGLKRHQTTTIDQLEEVTAYNVLAASVSANQKDQSQFNVAMARYLSLFSTPPAPGRSVGSVAPEPLRP